MEAWEGQGKDSTAFSESKKGSEVFIPYSPEFHYVNSTDNVTI